MASNNNNQQAMPSTSSSFDRTEFESTPSSKVELTISCRKLIDADVFSKSDPMCVMFTRQSSSGSWREYGRTEIIWDNLNPDFVKKFVIDYCFEERQLLKFSVFDIDSQSNDLSKHDFLGEMECSLGEIVSNGRFKKPLQGPKKNSGYMIISAEELAVCKEEITLRFTGHGLDKKDFFGKSDPFLVFYKANEDGVYSITHKTEYIKNTLNPVWKSFTLPITTLCNGDINRSIKVECYDWNRDGSHSIIGTFFTTIHELSQGKGHTNEYHLINEKKKQKKPHKYNHSGIVVLEQYSSVPTYSFMDYIAGGCQLQASIAIDFTASNGDPKDKHSLHYNDPRPQGNHMNQYETAIRAVGEIIQDYDSDKLFPALGFGAKLPPDGRVSHDFHLNSHPENPECEGIAGVLEAYKYSLNTVKLYGPTNFAPIVQRIANEARDNTGGSDYFILLIITDGIISDLQQTKMAIIRASSLPISIIIVGVGQADFTDMDILDGDEDRVSCNGRSAERDIVQFVPFMEFMTKKHGDTHASVKARLAREVLAEIPEQFVSYMKSRNIKPRPPMNRTSSFADAAPPTRKSSRPPPPSYSTLT